MPGWLCLPVLPPGEISARPRMVSWFLPTSVLCRIVRLIDGAGVCACAICRAPVEPPIPANGSAPSAADERYERSVGEVEVFDGACMERSSQGFIGGNRRASIGGD